MYKRYSDQEILKRQIEKALNKLAKSIQRSAAQSFKLSVPKGEKIEGLQIVLREDETAFGIPIKAPKK